MDAVREIVALLNARCGISSRKSPSLVELAREFALCDDRSIYAEIDSESADRLARFILHKDLAYGMERMPLNRAAALAEAFLAYFGSDARYYTNGNWHVPPAPPEEGVAIGANWTPATKSTFDTGLLIISTINSGCLWVEDED